MRPMMNQGGRAAKPGCRSGSALERGVRRHAQPSDDGGSYLSARLRKLVDIDLSGLPVSELCLRDNALVLDPFELV